MNGLARAQWKLRAFLTVVGTLVVWAMFTQASKETVLLGGVAACAGIWLLSRSVGRDLGRGPR